jgi:glycosyltransferase involved in cell wall biosynthesis
MDFDLATSKPGSAPKGARFTFHPSPLVSCLMVTRGDEGLMRQAIACFQAQTYGHRELIVVSAARQTDVAGFVAGLGDPRIRFVAAADAPLGGLRNASVAAAQGDLICQWDDDDLSDPRRLELMVSVLAASQCDAVFLSRVTLWWPARRRLVLSEARLWEGTMLARRGAVPPYPHYDRREDSAMVETLRQGSSVAVVDAPGMYVYRVTGKNTWDEAHFDALFATASRDLSDDYDARTASWPKPVSEAQ